MATAVLYKSDLTAMRRLSMIFLLRVDRGQSLLRRFFFSRASGVGALSLGGAGWSTRSSRSAKGTLLRRSNSRARGWKSGRCC